MAIGVDTVEILNGLDHEQDITTSILYSINSKEGEAVFTKELGIPVSDSQVNVIFNNDYDLDGSTVFVRVRVTKFLDATPEGIVKTETDEALAWVEIPGGASEGHIIETGSIDVSDCLAASLHIDVALSSTTAHTGTEVIVQTSSEAGSDGSWTNLTRYVCCEGTAISAALTATEPIGETVLAISNPVASGFDWDGKNIFIKNTVVADCEIVYQTEHGADA